jgi:hypothetical protein
MNSWVGFCLYVAGGVFIQDLKNEEQRGAQSLPNLDFLLAAMKAIAKRHSVTNHFTAQLELDIEAASIRSTSGPSAKKAIPNTPINGLLPERGGAPMTVSDLKSYRESDSNITIRSQAEGEFRTSPTSAPQTYHGRQPFVMSFLKDIWNIH